MLHINIICLLTEYSTRRCECSLQYALLLEIVWTILTLSSQVVGIPKMAAEDTTLVATNSQGGRTTIPIPKGTFLTIDTPGLHYNRKYHICS